MNIVKTGVYRAVSGFSPSRSLDVWEISLITEGGGTAYFGGAAESFAVGVIFIVPPKIIHSKSSSASFGWSYIQTDVFLPDASRYFRIADDEFGTCRALMSLVSDMRESSARALTAEALRRVLIERINGGGEVTSRGVGDVVTALCKNFTNPEYNAHDALTPVSYNHDYFRRRFKSETGVSPAAYLLNLRLTHAAALLRQRTVFETSITEIAASSGFYDSNYFARIFKKKYGVAPRDFA